MAVIFISALSYGQHTSDLEQKLIDQYVGEWVSIDPDTRSVTKVVIKNEEGVTVRAFGSCAPKDCDWGSTELHWVSDSIDDRLNVIPFDHGLALWDQGFAKKIVKFKIQTAPDPQLHMDITTIYKDNSGRRNYYFSTTLKKVH